MQPPHPHPQPQQPRPLIPAPTPVPQPQQQHPTPPQRRRRQPTSKTSAKSSPATPTAAGQPTAPQTPQTAEEVAAEQKRVAAVHVTIWNRAECRKIAGNAAPLRRNLHRYLERHPECEEYVGQDKHPNYINASAIDPVTGLARTPQNEHVPIWNRLERRKVTGNAAPLRKNLEVYLAKHPECDVYSGQDKVGNAAARVPAAATATSVNDWPATANASNKSRNVLTVPVVAPSGGGPSATVAPATGKGVVSAGGSTIALVNSAVTSTAAVNGTAPGNLHPHHHPSLNGVAATMAVPTTGVGSSGVPVGSNVGGMSALVQAGRFVNAQGKHVAWGPPMHHLLSQDGISPSVPHHHQHHELQHYHHDPHLHTAPQPMDAQELTYSEMVSSWSHNPEWAGPRTPMTPRSPHGLVGLAASPGTGGTNGSGGGAVGNGGSASVGCGGVSGGVEVRPGVGEQAVSGGVGVGAVGMGGCGGGVGNVGVGGVSTDGRCISSSVTSPMDVGDGSGGAMGAGIPIPGAGGGRRRRTVGDMSMAASMGTSFGAGNTPVDVSGFLEFSPKSMELEGEQQMMAHFSPSNFLCVDGSGTATAVGGGGGLMTMAAVQQHQAQQHQQQHQRQQQPPPQFATQQPAAVTSWRDGAAFGFGARTGNS